MLITVESLDWALCELEARLLCGRLNTGEGVYECDARLLTFPAKDRTFFGNLAAKLQAGKFKKSDPLLAAMLSVGDHYEMQDEITMNINRGRVVVCASYVERNIAFQSGYYRDRDRERVAAQIAVIEYKIFKARKPKHIFYLDMPAEHAFKRITATHPGRKLGWTKAYLKRVREAYLAMASQGWPWTVIPASLRSGGRRSAEEIVTSMYDRIIGADVA